MVPRYDAPRRNIDETGTWKRKTPYNRDQQNNRPRNKITETFKVMPDHTFRYDFYDAPLREVSCGGNFQDFVKKIGTGSWRIYDTGILFSGEVKIRRKNSP